MNPRFPGLRPMVTERTEPASEAPGRTPEDIIELSLLLPDWEAAALEEVARGRGLTTAHVIRQLIRGYLTTS